MTFDDVRALVRTWPEVTEGTSYGTAALKVRTKLLARLKEDGTTLVLTGIEPDERAMLMEARPAVFYITDHYRDWPSVLVRLPACPRGVIEPLLRRRWRALASKAALKAHDRDNGS